MSKKLIEKILSPLITWLVHKCYKVYGDRIFYIEGTEQDYPKYLLYTEDEEVRKKMKKLWWDV